MSDRLTMLSHVPTPTGAVLELHHSSIEYWTERHENGSWTSVVCDVYRAFEYYQDAILDPNGVVTRGFPAKLRKPRKAS